jgi:hypothetical protein
MGKTDSFEPVYPLVGGVVLEGPLGKKNQTDGQSDEDCTSQARNVAENHVHSSNQAAVCLPRRKFSSICSEVRREKARMLMVVVLSVQLKNTLASQT